MNIHFNRKRLISYFSAKFSWSFQALLRSCVCNLCVLLLMLWYMTKLSLVTLPTFLAFSHNQGMNNQVNYAKSNLVTLMRCLKAALEWQVAHHERWLRNHPRYEHEIEFLGNSVPKKWQQCHLESAQNITKDVTNFVCCDF